MYLFENIMQEPRVSSTSEREYQVPNKGILKQRGATLAKSKSASNIISLKAPQVCIMNFLNLEFSRSEVPP
jgi:hypothetical protein